MGCVMLYYPKIIFRGFFFLRTGTHTGGHRGRERERERERQRQRERERIPGVVATRAFDREECGARAGRDGGERWQRLNRAAACPPLMAFPCLISTDCDVIAQYNALESLLKKTKAENDGAACSRLQYTRAHTSTHTYTVLQLPPPIRCNARGE